MSRRRREDSDQEMTGGEPERGSGIYVSMIWAAGVASEGNLIYFIFIWVSGRIFLHSFWCRRRRGAAECIALTVLT